jgi:acyl-CoA thioesterase
VTPDGAGGRLARVTTAPHFPLAEFLGMTVEPSEPGTARAAVTCTAAHLNPHGTVHGAVMFTMVDTAMGAATMSVLDDKHWCASIDVQLRFCRPAFGGLLVATAEVVHAGKRVVHLEGRVHDQAGELVATASSSFAVLSRPDGQ